MKQFLLLVEGHLGDLPFLCADIVKCEYKVFSFSKDFFLEFLYSPEALHSKKAKDGKLFFLSSSRTHDYDDEQKVVELKETA